MNNEKISAVIDEVNTVAAERGELIECIALALLAKKNLFILGGTGQAKSFCINEFRKRITGAKQFEYLISKQTDEEKLFGRLDLSSLIPGSMPRDELLKDTPPLDVINLHIIPALNEIGSQFEQKKAFLPQLLMSAEAAKAAFEVVKEAMKGEDQQTKGKIILATVKGDIHDIGKNIVKVLLENYAYQVLDLGKDVPPEVIVDTAIREDIKVVGLSALMTTTVVSMEETIRQLREKKPNTKVVVGGAVLTQEYADSIGADCYAKDAMATVHFADSVFGV